MAHSTRSTYPALHRLPIGAPSGPPETLQTLPSDLFEHIVWCLQASTPLTQLMHTREVNKKHFYAVLNRLMLKPGQYLSGALFGQAHGDRCARLLIELGVLSFANTAQLEARHFCDERPRHQDEDDASADRLVNPPTRLRIDPRDTDRALADAFELLNIGLRRGLSTRTTAVYEACPCFGLLPEERAAFPLFAVDLFRLPSNAHNASSLDKISTDTLSKRIHAAKPTLSEELVSGERVLNAWYNEVDRMRGTGSSQRPTMLADVQATREAEAYVDLLVAKQDDVRVVDTRTVDVAVSVVAKLTIRRTCRVDAVREIERQLRTPASQLPLHAVNDLLFDAMDDLPEDERVQRMPWLFDFTLLAMEIGGTRYAITSYVPTSPKISPTSPHYAAAANASDTDPPPCDEDQFGVVLVGSTRYSELE